MRQARADMQGTKRKAPQHSIALAGAGARQHRATGQEREYWADRSCWAATNCRARQQQLWRLAVRCSTSLTIHIEHQPWAEGSGKAGSERAGQGTLAMGAPCGRRSAQLRVMRGFCRSYTSTLLPAHQHSGRCWGPQVSAPQLLLSHSSAQPGWRSTALRPWSSCWSESWAQQRCGPC